jgi:hypothetical protein
VGALQLSTHYGLGQALLLPSVLGSTLGLLEQFKPRAFLALCAARPYAYSAGTPLMAELLTRAADDAPRGAMPPICHTSTGRVMVPAHPDRPFRRIPIARSDPA